MVPAHAVTLRTPMRTIEVHLDFSGPPFQARARNQLAHGSGAGIGMLWLGEPGGVTKVAYESNPTSGLAIPRWTCPKPGSMKPVPGPYQVVTHAPFTSRW
jgi:hypothetical protein